MENIITKMFLVSIKHACNTIKLLLQEDEFNNLQPTDYIKCIPYTDCKFNGRRWEAKDTRGYEVEIVQGVGEVLAKIPTK